MDLYHIPGSPPCRSVIMAAKALGIEFNKKLVNLQEGEQLKPEYIKINPQHTVPTLVDNGFILWESRAIMIYLVEKYGKTDALYPKDPQKHAVINQRLYFDLGTLYKSFGDYFFPQLTKQAPADPEALKKLDAAFELLNTFLEGHKYAAGDSLTLADIAFVATVNTIVVCGYSLEKFPNIARWYDLCKKEVSGFDEDWQGCLMLKQYFDEKQKK